MLKKIRGVREDVADRERHWFQDESFDLFAWTRFIRNKIDDAATQLPVPKTPS